MKGEYDNMKIGQDESDCPVVANCSRSDDANYSELLEVMVEFGKKEINVDVEELISLMDWFEKYNILKGLHSIRVRVVDHSKSSCPRLFSKFWFLMTLMNSEDKQVMVEKFRQYLSSFIAIDHLPDRCDDVDSYSKLMDLAGTELRKIKHEYPNQVGTMSTASELHSTSELCLSLFRGLKCLLYKIKMIELYVWYKYPCRAEMQEFVDRMLESVEDEVEQYEQELEKARAKIQQVLNENLKKKAVEEKKEGDHDDDATANEQRQFQSLECKVREWWNIVKGEYSP